MGILDRGRVDSNPLRRNNLVIQIRRGEPKRLPDVLRFEFGVFLDDLVPTNIECDCLDDSPNRQAHAANRRLATDNHWVGSDTVEVWHVDSLEGACWRLYAAGRLDSVLASGAATGAFDRHGTLIEEPGSANLADIDANGDNARTLTPLQAAACTYRIAFGPRVDLGPSVVRQRPDRGRSRKVIERSP